MSDIERIETGAAPTPLGPYAHAVRAGGFVFCSGQGAREPGADAEAGLTRDADGRITAHDTAVQTRVALANVKLVLEAAGTSWDRLVELNVYLREMDDFDTMNAVYREHFPSGGPARTTIGVADLPGDNWVEIRAVALA